MAAPKRDYYEYYYKKTHERALPPLDHLFTSLQLRVFVAWRAPLPLEWVVEEHPLPCNKIYYVYRGVGGYTVDGVSFPMKAGDVGLLPAGHRNSCWHDPKNPIDKAWIHFDARVLGLVDLFDLIPCPPPFDIREDAEVPVLLDRVIRESGPDGAKASFQPLAVNGALMLALAKILRAAQAVTFARPQASQQASQMKGGKDLILRGADDRVARVLAYIAEHYADSLTLERLAGVVHLHPTYFSNHFRKATGVSPMAFLQHFRIDRAKSLLASSDLPVMEVAARVGFADPYHFSRVFKKLAGLPPTQFQASVRG